MTRKARIEGAEASPAPAPSAGKSFGGWVEQFTVKYPEEWEMLRLCPLQHGLIEMKKRLD